MRMPPPPPNQPFTPGKWTKTIWLLVKFKNPLGLFQVTSIINLYMQCIPFFLAYFGIAPIFFLEITHFLQGLGVKVLRQCWALTIDFLGSPLVRFLHGVVPDLRRTPSSQRRKKSVPREESCGFVRLKCYNRYLNEGGWRWCIEFCLIWYEIIESKYIYNLYKVY